MGKPEYSANNFLVDSRGLYSGHLEKQILEKFGYVGKIDRGESSERNIQERREDSAVSKERTRSRRFYKIDP